MDIERFDCTNGGTRMPCHGCYTMEKSEFGDYVRFDDYAKLQQQNAELSAQLEAVRGELVEVKNQLGQQQFLAECRANERDELKSKLAELDKQPPVKYLPREMIPDLQKSCFDFDPSEYKNEPAPMISLYSQPKPSAQRITEQEPVTWLCKSKAHKNLYEFSEPNQKATNPKYWTDAFPVYALNEMQSNKAQQRITEQDAREILDSAIKPLRDVELFNFSDWWHYAGRTLLDKLNEHREPVQESQPLAPNDSEAVAWRTTEQDSRQKHFMKLGDMALRATLLNNEIRRSAPLTTHPITQHEGIFIPMDLWHPLRDLLRDAEYVNQIKPVTANKAEVPEDAAEIIRAVAHIGVDYGYGAYDLEEKYIHAARDFVRSLPPLKDGE